MVGTEKQSCSALRHGPFGVLRGFKDAQGSAAEGSLDADKRLCGFLYLATLTGPLLLDCSYMDIF